MVVNDHDLVCEAAVAGLGFARLPEIVCRQALARGALEQAATLVQTTRDLGHLQLRGEEAGLCAGWQGRLAVAQGERAVAQDLLARAQAIHRGLGAGEDSELGRLIGRLVGDLGAG